jgi:hypothetical protein
MRPRHVYLLLCVAGVLLPYSRFVPWLLEHGLNLSLFWRELFANRIGAFFGMDVLVSAVVLCIFAARESVRLGMGPATSWLTLLAVLSVGVSLGLPLFLYLREVRIDRTSAA